MFDLEKICDVVNDELEEMLKIGLKYMVRREIFRRYSGNN